MLKKNLRILPAACLMILVLSCCNKNPEIQPVQITLMHGWGGSGADHVVMREIYESFHEANPDIELLYDASPDISVVLEKAMSMLALDEMPDIMSTNGYEKFVQGAVRKGFALDLTPYLAEDADFTACVSEETLQTWQTEEGAIYTLPDVREVAGYWYNKDLLLSAGVGQPPTNWNEFWDSLDKIDTWSRENKKDILPVHLNQAQAKLLLGALLAEGSPEGADFMQGKSGSCATDALEKALAGIELAYSYGADRVPSDNDARQEFLEGKTAYYFNGVWASISFDEDDNLHNIRYAAYPGNNGSSISFVTPASGYVVGNTGSPEKIEACVRFLKYMLSDEIQRRIVSETLQAPSNPHVDVGWIITQAPMLGQALAQCYAADTHIISFETLLDEKSNLVLDTYLAGPNPSEHNIRELVYILTQNSSKSQ